MYSTKRKKISACEFLNKFQTKMQTFIYKIALCYAYVECGKLMFAQHNFISIINKITPIKNAVIRLYILYISYPSKK